MAPILWHHLASTQVSLVSIFLDTWPLGFRFSHVPTKVWYLSRVLVKTVKFGEVSCLLVLLTGNIQWIYRVVWLTISRFNSSAFSRGSWLKSRWIVKVLHSHAWLGAPRDEGIGLDRMEKSELTNWRKNEGFPASYMSSLEARGFCDHLYTGEKFGKLGIELPPQHEPPDEK